MLDFTCDLSYRVKLFDKYVIENITDFSIFDNI